MKRMFTLLLMVACNSAWSVEPVALPYVVQAQRAANAAVCESYKGDHSALGKAMIKQCRARASAEFDSLQDEKSLKECIKPGNVIDDDVRKCMKGL